MNDSSKGKKSVAGPAGLVVLALAGVFAFFVTATTAEDQMWSNRRLEIFKGLQTIQSEFKKAQVAQESFVLTGDINQLQEFQRAKQGLLEGSQKLPSYNESFRQLQGKIQAAMDQFQFAIDVRKKKGEQAAREVLLTSRETRALNEIDEQIGAALMGQLVQSSERTLEYSGLVKYFRNLFFVFLVLIGIAYYFVLKARLPALQMAEEKNRLLTAELAGVKTQLEKLANVDFLTEVLNIRGLDHVLAIEENRTGRSGGQLVALLVACDNFRRINEGLGHAVGDVLLKELAKRISTTLRPSDHVARVGGDEFLVLLPDTQAAYAMRVAERIRLSVCDSPLRSASDLINVTVSIGVAPMPAKVSSVEEVVGFARAALRRSKLAGKNRISLARESTAEEDSPAARDIVEVLCDGSHFRTVFQPVVDLSTEQIAGYEVFTRGPDGAFESPADFFRICVENNVLTTVDILCAKLCISSVANIQNNMRFHMNIFPSTLLDTPIERFIGLFPQDKGGKVFCVEISEQQFVGDPSYLRDHVNALKQAGILVAIDDVGFGRSSLESLILLEPDMVKVDRKYVTGVASEPAKARLLKRVVNVAKSLGAEIVAEGIEDKLDLPVLQELGVHYGQGYYWGELLETLPMQSGSRHLQPERKA